MSITTNGHFQVGALVPGEKKFLIDQELWSLLSNTQKAGLVLHEVLWSYYKKNNNELKESSLIRRFNAILSSLLMNQSTAEQYVQVIRQGRNSFQPVSAIEFYESGAVRKGRLSKSIDILLPQG